MIDTLFTQTLEQNNTDYILKLPSFLLNETEKNIVKFIIDYTEKHGKTPTQERFKKEGYGHYLTTHYTGSPLSDILDMTLDQKRSEYLLKSFQDIQVGIDRDNNINPKDIARIYDDLTKTYTSGTVDLTAFERKPFYTTKKPDSLLFGWDTIDNPTGGILPGEYAILAARLGEGKSLISVYLAQMWAKQGRKVLFIPCEMTIEQTVYRIDAFLGGFNPLVFRTKQKYGEDEAPEKEVQEMFDSYYELVNMELENIKRTGGNIIFPDKPVRNVMQLKSLIKSKKPDITIIDALYLMGDNNGNVSSDWKVLKEISNEIKALCITDNQRVFCTTQLKRTGKEMDFNTEDVAYTDAFGQDCDLLMTMYTVPAHPKRKVLELKKVRHGSNLGGIEVEVDWRNMTLETVDTMKGFSKKDDIGDDK